MKEKITDLMKFIPEEYLDGIDIEGNEIGNKKVKVEKRGFWRNKAAISVAASLAVVLCGFVGYTILKPNLLKEIVNEKKLEGELVQNTYKQVENDNYRMTVETVITDVNSQYILLSLEAISDEAKRDFEKLEPNFFVTFSRGGGGSFSEYTVLYERYKKYYVYKGHSTSKEGNMECIVGMLKEGYEDNFDVYELYGKLLQKDGYSDLDSVDEEVLNTYKERTYKEAAYMTISFDIEVKDKNITISQSENAFPKDNYVMKITVRRLSVAIDGWAKEDQTDDILLPTIVYRYKDGTEQGILKGNMGYDSGSGGNFAGNSGGCQMEEGIYTYIGRYPYALDIDKIEVVIINGVEYEIR